MRKKWLALGGLLIIVLLGIWAYNVWFGTTKIAFVNFQTITMGGIAKANDNSFIKLQEVPVEELDRLSGFDMVFVNGMGLRVVEEQRQQIQKAADKGVLVYTTMATNPANNICTIDSVDQVALRGYLGSGGRRNYKNMLNYIRKNMDKKLISVEEPGVPIERSSDVLYHVDVDKPGDELDFVSVEEYEKYLKSKQLYKEGAKKIVVTGQMADATGLIDTLERVGYNVYPVLSLRRLLDFVREISPDAIINMAHGRLGDEVVKYLEERNILLFAPLTVNSLVEEWEQDPMGMSGGFMSQSIVTPEIDGAIRTSALFAQYEDKEGLRHSFAVPSRLKTYVENIQKTLALKEKPNSEKRVVIYYYKGPGQSAMSAAGMEVVPSLYNLLKKMKEEGYRVENLPANSKELEKMIMAEGAVFGTYANGVMDRFLKESHPLLISKEEYESWVKQALRPEKYAEVVAAFGEFPGEYMSTADGKLGVSRIQFGNVVIMPQPAAGGGDNVFQIVHGTDVAPPHSYVAAYLWMQYGFKADAMIHFGTHGSLEFTPKKQAALCDLDWPDRLVGSVPHFYIYSIGNVGEGMIAKRRGYGVLQSYLTPPFMESNVRGIYRNLTEKIKIYNQKVYPERGTADPKEVEKAALSVKKLAVSLGMHRELGLDSVLNVPLTEEEILKIENFADELSAEKVTGQLYTMGVPYEAALIESSVYSMATDPIAYGLFGLDRLRGKADADVLKRKTIFTERYLDPAKRLVGRLLNGQEKVDDGFICQVAGITKEELAQAREIDQNRNAPKGMMAMMMAAAAKQPEVMPVKKEEGEHPMSGMMKNMMKQKGPDAKTGRMQANRGTGGNPDMSAMMKAMMGKKAKEYSKEEVNKALAIMEVERTLKNVNNYKRALQESPDGELQSLMNALNGGYTAPSPGGDPIVNPNTLPTGRNLFAINAEETPTESAWEKGVQLAKNTIEMYQKRHNGEFPKKISYTLWSGEFIETGGATIAQVLYMLGVEPVRDAFGRVSDLKLIPSADLGRPRIDVVVQTSGQLRDIAASRLFLVNRAVEMAAAAKNDQYENQVAAGVLEAEKTLIDKGISPKDAREISTFRVFGGANGGYGTGIQGMVDAGDRWEDESEIAATYLNNMGVYYGSEKNWEKFQQFAFEAALTRTDVVVQPRQSNTWGALSLDHVYEFMGGLNLTVRNVTGKDPDAYLSDYRNRNNNKMQEVKEAIGVESRTTIFNPSYIKEKMKGEATSATGFAEIVRNTYGWNVMKPSVIDNEMWDEIYNVYVKDKFNLGVQDFFEKQSPAALQEITAVMMETARKGMWKATDQQLADLSNLHTDLIQKYKPACSGFVCDNAKLRDFIASKATPEAAKQYQNSIKNVREVAVDQSKGVVMKKDEITSETQKHTNKVNTVWIVVGVVVILGGLAVLMRKRRRNRM
ncbi:MAG TPA: protoporphyrin IX magnesium chelatase [Butyricimonas sp.]|uniref:cobaltochelatase subunit CobN n=1 Tax=Butyricimonas sp. TaxID=1969738 RepID=UPI000EDF2D5F|nr:cobaltochelatase subunit CobN [Butyricimonas sp.]HAM85506.1 protoporphyrin IX magnesium chelatase [Butyricimonas sp.]HCH91092.1 protoporphyrin IX magnesium chelatase [Butyricimonas sp.]